MAAVPAVASTRSAIDIVVPGLFRQPVPGLAALEHLLARSSRSVVPASSEALLFHLFGHAPIATLPVAAVRLLGEGLEPGGEWLQADPVQFVPARDHVLVMPTEPLDAAELGAIAEEIGRHFELEVQVLQGQLLLRRAAPVGVVIAPTARVLGHSLGSVLPEGREHLPWLSLINEIQMLLHSSAVNRAREQRGIDPVNGLWLWGGGPLPSPVASPFTYVWGGDSLLRGLALLGGCEARALPGDAAPAVAVGHGRQLIVFPEDADPAGLEVRWFRPLLAALRGGKLSRVSVYDAEGRAFAISRPALYRFWRRPRPLESYQQ